MATARWANRDGLVVVALVGANARQIVEDVGHIGMVWPALAFEEGEGVPGTRGRLGVLSLLPQGHGTLVEPTRPPRR